ncbi:MAG: GNAT family N-acetyltransferase, partial [Planctomycetota bacterium]|nr:GNAT family N-acetyltransferase [Planctomycetota bacterium]
MSVRGYQPSDRDACRSLWAEMVQRHREIYEDPSIGGDNPGLEFDDHLAKVGPERIWVATVGGDVVGLVSLIEQEQQAEIEPIVVSSRHRGKGIGRKLLQHAVERAKAAGALCLGVKPVARNEEAIAVIYENGFTALSHVQLFMWLGESIP